MPKTKQKRSSVEAALEKSSTRRDLSRFEYEVDLRPQLGVKSVRVSKGGRVGSRSRRASTVDKGGRVGRS